MKVKITHGSPQRAELNRFKAENVFLKRKVALLEGVLSKIEDVLNNNDSDSSWNSAIGRIRVSPRKKQIRRKNIGRPRRLISKHEKRASVRHSDASLGTTDINLNTKSQFMNSTSNSDNSSNENDNFPSVEYHEDDGSGSSIYFTAHSTLSSDEEPKFDHVNSKSESDAKTENVSIEQEILTNIRHDSENNESLPLNMPIEAMDTSYEAPNMVQNNMELFRSDVFDSSTNMMNFQSDWFHPQPQQENRPSQSFVCSTVPNSPIYGGDSSTSSHGGRNLSGDSQINRKRRSYSPISPIRQKTPRESLNEPNYSFEMDAVRPSQATAESFESPLHWSHSTNLRSTISSFSEQRSTNSFLGHLSSSQFNPIFASSRINFTPNSNINTPDYEYDSSILTEDESDHNSIPKLLFQSNGQFVHSKSNETSSSSISHFMSHLQEQGPNVLDVNDQASMVFNGNLECSTPALGISDTSKSSGIDIDKSHLSEDYQNVFNTSFMQTAVGYFARVNTREFSISEFLPPNLRDEEKEEECNCCLCTLGQQNGKSFKVCVKNHPNSVPCQKYVAQSLTVCNACMSSMKLNSEKRNDGLISCIFDECLSKLKWPGLQTHYLKHLNVQKFQCGICDKGYSSKQALKTHERTNHST